MGQKIILNDNPDYTDKIERIYNWVAGKSQPPFKMIIIPTNRCNLNCFSCPNSSSRYKGVFKEEEEVKDEGWFRLVKEGLKLGVKEWYILGGGEPLLRKNLVLKIIKVIKSYNKNYICEIITNGTLLTEDVVNEFVKHELDKVLVSIDGPDAEIHDYMRDTKNVFKNVSDNLKLFKVYKKRFKSEKPVIQMNTVISNKNYNLIPDIVRFAAERDVREVALHPMRIYDEMNHGTKSLILSEEQKNVLHKSIFEAERLSKKLGVRLNKDMVWETENLNKAENLKSETAIQNKFLSTKCYEPLYSLLIDPKGHANYCCPAGDGGKEHNPFKTSLREVWYSDYFNHVRKQIIENKALKSCSNCGLLDMTSRLKTDMKKYVSLLENS